MQTWYMHTTKTKDNNNLPSDVQQNKLW